MSIKEKSLEIKAKLNEIEALKKVELLAGQLDEKNRREMVNRLPALLLLVGDTPLDKLDYEYGSTAMYQALLLHSNKRSGEDQVLDMFDLIDSSIKKLKQVRDLTLINYAPVESSEELIAYELNFKYMERI